MGDEVVYLPSIVPVFPLPGVVLFPQTIIPLHIFEPRYRAMTADALSGDRTIGVALLKEGFEPLYHTRRAPIHPVLGLGRIVESEQIKDGNYNVLLRGIARARIVEEVPERPYRLARVEPVETFCSAGEVGEQELREALFLAIRGNRGLDRKLRHHWLRLRDVPLGLDELADLLAAGLPAQAELRQCLLEEVDARSRADMILTQIRALDGMARTERAVGPPKRHQLN